MTEFKPIPNPFIVGNPIKNREMFFGRQDDFEYIKRKLQSGIKSYIIVFCGERRSGKTSILFQVLNGELGENFLPIMIDMQTMAGLHSENEFFEKISKEIYKSLDESKIDIQQYNFFLEETSPYKVFDKLLHDIHDAYSGKNILFLIDEYELIESKIVEGSLNKNFVPFLAGVLESERKISFLFTGSKKLDERKAPYWNILFAKSMYRNVSFLSRNDTLRLITEPVKNIVTYDNEIIDKIYRLTGGQPFYTQVVCQNIVDHLNDHQKNHVEVEDLNQIVEEILENPLPQMIYFWNSLSNEKKMILSLLSEMLEDANSFVQSSDMHKFSRKREFGINLSIKTISTTLETLYHQQLLKKTESGYSFYMDLFRGWIKQDHSFWQVMKEISTDISGINVEDSISIAKTSYEQEPSFFDKEKKKRKFLIPAIGSIAIIIALAGYFLFLKPSSESQAISDKNASSPISENIPTKNEPSAKDVQSDQSNPGVTEDNNIKKESEVPQKPDEGKSETKNTESVLKSKALQSQRSMEDAKKAALQAGATNTAQYQQALSSESKAEKNLKSGQYESASSLFALAASDFTASKSAAINKQRSEVSNLLQEVSAAENKAQQNNASKLASKTFSEAHIKEKEGREFFNRGHYDNAQSALSEANRLYALAAAEAAKSLNELSNEIQTVQTSLKEYQSKSAEYAYLDEYKQAVSTQQQGEASLQHGDEISALENLQKAHDLFQQAQTTHKENVEQVNGIIQKYRSALERKDIQQIMNLWPGINQREREGLSQFFRAVENLRADFSTESITFSRNTAIALLNVRMVYSGAEGSGKLNNWEMEFSKTSSGWVISTISHGN